MGGALVMMAPAACGGDGGDGPDWDPSGRIGHAGFRWECSGAGDLGCSVGAAFPRAVAVGSSYEIRASSTVRTPDEVTVSRVVLIAAIRTGIRSGNELQAVEPGEVTLMALSPDGELVDFTTIEQVPVQGLRLASALEPVFPPSCHPGSTCADAVWDDPPDPLEFVSGRITQVRAEPSDELGTVLMGHLDYEWEVTPPAVATLGNDDSGNEVSIDVHSPGRFQVRVSAGGHTELFEFGAVSEGPTRRRPEVGDSGDETDTDGTDTEGTDTDTEGSTGGSGGETEGTGTTTGGGM